MTKWLGYSVDGSRVRFQRRIPEDLQDAFGGSAWIRIPLKMPPGREAQRKALCWWVAYEEEFARLRDEASGAPRASTAQPMLKPLSEFTPEEMRALVLPAAHGHNLGQHAAILTGARSFEQLEENHSTLANAVRDVLRGKGSDVLSLLSTLFLVSRHIPHEPADESFRRFVFESARVLKAEAVEPNARRLQGDDVPPPPLPEAGAGLKIPASAGLTLGAVIESYLKSLPENHYRRKLVLCLTLLREVVGPSTLVKDLRNTHVRDFLLTVCRLPSDWGKRFKEKAVPLATLLKEEGAKVLSETTYCDSYRATLTKFLGDALRDHGDDGFPSLSADYPYTGNREKGEAKQRNLEEHELVRLFEGAEFASIASDPERERHYWLPVIGLYSGARPREICQLNPQCDFGKAGDVWFLTFDENTAAGQGVVKTIKTGETRRIPLHPELVRLGLPEYLERLRESGADRLFPGFRIKGGNPYSAAGEEISDLRRATGLYDNNTKGAMVTGMYTFRKTFATYGDEQHIDVRPFVGHRDHGKNMTEQHYITRPKKMPFLYDKFKALHFPVTIPERAV